MPGPDGSVGPADLGGGMGSGPPLALLPAPLGFPAPACEGGRCSVLAQSGSKVCVGDLEKAAGQTYAYAGGGGALPCLGERPACAILGDEGCGQRGLGCVWGETGGGGSFQICCSMSSCTVVGEGCLCISCLFLYLPQPIVTPPFCSQLTLTIVRQTGGLGISIAGGKGSTPYKGDDEVTSVGVGRAGGLLAGPLPLEAATLPLSPGHLHLPRV